MTLFLTFWLVVSTAFADGNDRMVKDWIIQPNTDTTAQTAVLYIFTGSDWCRECRRLDEQVLTNEAFQENMEAHQIGLQIVDFPQRKKLDVKIRKQNELIAEKYNFDGVFPTLVLSPNHQETYQRLYYRNETSEVFSQLIINELRKLQE